MRSPGEGWRLEEQADDQAASRRTVDLPERAVEALRRHRKRLLGGSYNNTVNSASSRFSGERSPPYPWARSTAFLLHSSARSRHAPQVRPAPRRPRRRTGDARPQLSLDALYGPQHRRRYGRGFGIESTADVLLTRSPTPKSGAFVYTGLAGKRDSRRADSNRFPAHYE
jgi:hypothetical protein